MAISRRRVFLRVAESWLHTAVSLLAMTLVMGVAVALASRFGGARVVIGILMGVFSTSLVMFILSEVVITTLFRAVKPDPVKHGRFIAAVSKVWRGRLFSPRLYVVEMGVPNAFAFGMGFLGQYGIAISQELYDLLDHEELEGVVAHEVGHIKCKDVGLMTVIQIITGGAEQLANLVLKGSTALGSTPLAYVLGWSLKLFSRFIFPMGKSAISQEREFAADALAALYTGTTRGLRRALEKLSAAAESRTQSRKEEMFSDLFISHPKMAKRLAALSSLEE